MKQCKPASGLLLALILTLVMAVPASAEGPQGSITINKAVPRETYNIYLIFPLEGHAGDAYSYTIENSSPWYGFVTGSGAGTGYVTVENGYVTWKYDDEHAPLTEEQKAVVRAEFAKKALIYAQSYNGGAGIQATATQKAGDASAGSTTTVNFTGLDAGYYLVDSSLGALCALGTAADAATITEKNAVPSIEKKVETSPAGDYGASSAAGIGDTLRFQTTITTKHGAQRYVVHDTMSAGLTFDGVESVQLIKAADSSQADFPYTLLRADSLDPGSRPADGCTFEITFGQGDLDTLITGDQLVITYTATLNKNAVVAGDGNPNQTGLDYGDSSHIEAVDPPKIYTYSFDLVKTDSGGAVLNGAEFELYSNPACNVKLELVEGGGSYRVATTAEKAAPGFASAVIHAGTATVEGLGNGTYYLKETKQPTGYNILTEPVEFTIRDGNLTAVMTNNSTYASGGVRVINNAGTALPTTGGMGVTLFYVLGGALMAGAAVLLVVKRRTDRAGT